MDAWISPCETILSLYPKGFVIEFLYRDRPSYEGLINNLGEVPGSGKMATVYVYRSCHGEYAVKKMSFSIDKFPITVPTPLRELIKLYSDYDASMILAYNGGNPDLILNLGDTFRLPRFTAKCRLRDSIIYRSNDSTGESLFLPAGSLICKTGRYPEAILGMLMSQYVRSGKCIHFVDTIDFVSLYTTPSYDKGFQCLVMEKIDRTLYESELPNDITYSEATLIQIYAAIAVYQEEHQVVHGDLHGGNVFLLDITPSRKWNEMVLADASYFEYQIHGVTFFLPTTPFLVKLGDWGLACKYSETVVASKIILEHGANYDDSSAPVIPNFYSPVYDLLFITTIFFANNKRSPFIRRCMAWCLGQSSDISRRDLISFAQGTYIDEESCRPFVASLRDDLFLSGSRPYVKCALDLLRNPELMRDYYDRPSGVGIVLTNV